MRIVQLITRPQRRGAEIFAIQLAESLLKMGHEVIVISLLEGNGEIQYSGKLIALDLSGKRRFDFTGFKLLAKLFQDIKPDIVQANASHTLRLAVGAKYFYTGKFRLIYRNANQISPFLKGVFQRWYNCFLLNQTDGVISVSHASKADLLEVFGLKKVVEVIPIGIDSSEIDSMSSGVLNIDLPESYLLHMGAWVPEKDPLGLLEVYAMLIRSKGQNLPLVFLGSGQLKTAMIAKIQELDLVDHVYLVSNQQNPFPILKRARALLMPSKIEGLPAVILEAMYLEVPVLAYHVGGIGEAVNSETGWAIYPGDKDAFGNAVYEVLQLTHLELDRITSNAKALVLKDYEISEIARRFMEFYKNQFSGE